MLNKKPTVQIYKLKPIVAETISTTPTASAPAASHYNYVPFSAPAVTFSTLWLRRIHSFASVGSPCLAALRTRMFDCACVKVNSVSLPIDY